MTPAYERIIRYFQYGHLREPLRSVSKEVADVAERLLAMLPENNAEVTAGLRKLLEAKDCFVRAKLDEL